MYICMHVTACIFGWHKATSLIENLGNNSAFPNLHVSLPTGISHQLIMVEEVPSSVISPSNLCTKNRNCLKPVQRIRYTRLCMKKNRKSKHGQAILKLYLYLKVYPSSCRLIETSESTDPPSFCWVLRRSSKGMLEKDLKCFSPKTK